MSKKKTNKQLQNLIMVTLSALSGFLLTYGAFAWTPDFILQSLKGDGSIWWENPLKILLALFALWAALAVHELGHLLTGLWQGFQFQLYVAGFLGVRRNPLNDQIEWYFNRDFTLMGGVAASLPIRQSANLLRQQAAVVAAGPLSSLLGTILGGIPVFLILFYWPDLADQVGVRLALVFLLIFGISSFLLFLATTIPRRTGAFFTDRARFFRLLGGGEVAARELAVLELLAQSYTQQPYREMDPTKIDLIEADEAAVMKAFACSLRYYYHLDREEKALALQAAAALEPLLEDQPLTFKVELQKDLVFAYAFLAQNAQQAREVWDKMGKLGQQAKDAHGLLAKAALFWSEQRTSEAGEAIEQGLNALPKEIVKYNDQFYKLQFKALQEKIY